MSQTAMELLRLLAQNAPAARLLEQAEALAADDPDAAAIARELALRVRAGIDAHARREAELSALVETARELASRTDPAGVLDAIVRRAHTLLGADVAYLTLGDPDRGDTYMRATSGSVSARFQSLRLPAGAGLGGLVAQARRPHWTPDYPSDDRYRHTSEIDAAVAEEGLVAICGVPLLVEDRFVGVLFAANRTRRTFRPDEVALLGSLAVLAAVSLVQSRRVTETEAALAALSAAHAGIMQAAEAHDRFVEVVLGGGDVDDIAGTLASLLGCWVAVLDADAQRLATCGDAPPPGPHRDPLAADPAVLASAATGRLAQAAGRCAVAVTAAGQRLGTLVLGGIGTLDGGQGRTVERAAMVTALVLLFRLRAAEADVRMRDDLLADLLGRRGDGVDPALVERGRLLGMRLHQPHVVLVCRCGHARPRGLVLAAARAGEGRGLAGHYQEAVVAVVPGQDPSVVATALARQPALGEAGVTIGAAGPAVPARGLRELHAEAARAADALIALGLAGRAATMADLGFAGLVSTRGVDVAAYLERVLGPVLDYDERRGRDLLGTLEAWFACGASPSRAAGRLHLHVNTVGQRLERLTTLLGAGWQEPERALEIQVALRLRRIQCAEPARAWARVSG